MTWLWARRLKGIANELPFFFLCTKTATTTMATAPTTEHTTIAATSPSDKDAFSASLLTILLTDNEGDGDEVIEGVGDAEGSNVISIDDTVGKPEFCKAWFTAAKRALVSLKEFNTELRDNPELEVMKMEKATLT